MQNSKLFLLLNSLSNKELRAFEDFILSPFFNKHAVTISLFYLLKPYFKGRGKAFKLNRMELFQQLFPEKDYDERELNHLLSQLLKLGEQFLAFLALKANELKQRELIIEATIRRGLEKSYQQNQRQAQQQLATIPIQDEHYFYQQYRLAELGDYHFSSQNVRKYDSHLQTAADQFDQFYLLRKLKFLCAMLDRKKLLQQQYEMRWFEPVIDHIKQSHKDQHPVIGAYFMAAQALYDRENPVYFQQLKNNYLPLKEQITQKDLRDLYYYAINYCIDRIRFGKRAYAEALLDLYETGIASSTLLDEGVLSPWTFKNMVRLGLSLQQFDWVQLLIKDYIQMLPEIHQQDAYHYNLADLHYQQGQFDQALVNLNQVEFRDIHYNLGARAMLLKIYYEQQEEDALRSLIASFKLFLKRNTTLAKSVKLPYSNFTDFVYKMIKYGATQQAQILTDIQNCSSVYDRRWLLTQLQLIADPVHE